MLFAYEGGKVLVLTNNGMCTGPETHFARIDAELIELVSLYQDYYFSHSGQEEDFGEVCEQLEDDIGLFLANKYPELDVADLGDLDEIEIQTVDPDRKFAIIPDEWGGEKIVDQDDVPLFDLAALIDTL